MPTIHISNMLVAGGDWLGWSSIAPASVVESSSSRYVLELGDGTQLILAGSNLAGAGPGPTSGEITAFSWMAADGSEFLNASRYSVDAAVLAGWPAAAIASASGPPPRVG